MALIIRDFEPADLETLWQIDQECFPPGISYSRLELKIYIRRHGAITLVAADDLRPSEPNKTKMRNVIGSSDTSGNRRSREAIAGFIVAHAGATGHIITIDVLASARRLGVGSLLLQSAEARLREAGSQAVSLETAVDNRSALSFYKRHGYSVIKAWPRYYSNGVDALVLMKNLDKTELLGTARVVGT